MSASLIPSGDTFLSQSDPVIEVTTLTPKTSPTQFWKSSSVRRSQKASAEDSQIARASSAAPFKEYLRSEDLLPAKRENAERFCENAGRPELILPKYYYGVKRTKRKVTAMLDTSSNDNFVDYPPQLIFKRRDDFRRQTSEPQLVSSNRLRKDSAVFIEKAVPQLDTSPGAVPLISQ